MMDGDRMYLANRCCDEEGEKQLGGWELDVEDRQG